MADGDYINLNHCRSGNVNLNSTTLVALCSFIGSEVFISNKTGQTIKIFDQGYTGHGDAFLLDDNDTITIRGLTNCNQVSAIIDANNAQQGRIYIRSQFYSFNSNR